SSFHLVERVVAKAKRFVVMRVVGHAEVAGQLGVAFFPQAARHWQDIAGLRGLAGIQEGANVALENRWSAELLDVAKILLTTERVSAAGEEAANRVAKGFGRRRVSQGLFQFRLMKRFAAAQRGQ